MLTRSRAAAKAREEQGRVVVKPSATGLGTHTKWVYPDNKTTAPAPARTAPPSPPPSPPKRTRPSARRSGTNTPRNQSAFNATPPSIPSRLGTPISLGSSSSIGVPTPRSGTPVINSNLSINGSTYSAHSSNSFLHPVDNRSARSSVTPSPLSTRSTPDPEGCHIVNGAYVCDCLDVPSGPPPLMRSQFPATPPQNYMNQAPVSRLHAPRKSQGLRYVNYSYEEGEILDWGDTDTFTTIATSEIMGAHGQLKLPVERSMTQARMNEIIARETEALLAQRNRGLVEDTEMEDVDSDSEGRLIDTPPTTEFGFPAYSGGAFYIRGDTVETEEPGARCWNGQLQYEPTEIIAIS